MTYSGKVAAITGAGSGIGRALAIELANRGAELALSDIDQGGLEETADRCERHERAVSRTVVDVADREQVFGWADGVAARHDRINFVFNNAGVAMSATAQEQPIQDFEWLMNINFWGVVHGTQAFLPHLHEAGDGHVVNISSVFGLMSIPSQSAYNASKFAVRGYSDTLRMELEMQGSPVSVTTVHPGGIKTAIVRNANIVGSADPHLADRFEKHLAWTSPEAAARQILRAVERKRRRALIGLDAGLFDIVARLPASVSQRVTMAAARRVLEDTGDPEEDA